VHTFNRLLTVFSAIVALVVGGLAAPTSAGVGAGQPCAHGGNFSATGCVNGRNGERYYAGFDDFRNVALTATGASASNLIHINQEMWFYTHATESQWVEMGLRQGYWIPCGCVRYVRFWADFDAAHNEYRHTIAYPAADGTDHQYEVLRNSSNHNNWDVYVDYNFIGTSTNQGSATGYEVQHGLETTVINGNVHSGLANHSPLEYMNSAGAFVHDPYEATWVDSRCSGTTTGTYCLTGYGNGSDVWEAAKG
jgi:hypothetical protein